MEYHWPEIKIIKTLHFSILSGKTLSSFLTKNKTTRKIIIVKRNKISFAIRGITYSKSWTRRYRLTILILFTAIWGFSLGNNLGPSLRTRRIKSALGTSALRCLLNNRKSASIKYDRWLIWKWKSTKAINLWKIPKTYLPTLQINRKNSSISLWI